jgi:hypothetical protein
MPCLLLDAYAQQQRGGIRAVKRTRFEPWVEVDNYALQYLLFWWWINDD